MLQGELYNVITQEDHAAVVQTRPESVIYAAHFPGFPITPGVCLVQLALELTGWSISGAKDIRFVQPVPPGSTLHVAWDNSGSILISLPDGTLCCRMTVVRK